MLEYLSLDYISKDPQDIPPRFNWMAVLKDLADGAPITELDHYKLKRLAESWPTCACGQLCKNLPRNSHGQPRDHWLMMQGIHFNGWITIKAWKEALSTFHEIEARTIELLEKQKQ